MNNQQVSKIVNFYRINHSFHDPYCFLLDGNFISLLVQKEIDLGRKLKNVLSARLTLKTTKCVLHELELLGEDFKLVLERARSLVVINCKHNRGDPVDACIAEQVGETNDKLYIVCSQDLELRRALRDLENVPLMYFGPDQRVTMEDIQKRNLQSLETQIKSKFLPNEIEQAGILQYKAEQALAQKERRRKELSKLSSIQGVKLNLKITKGPNPLAVKKKKRESNAGGSSAVPEKTKRIRKRNKNKPIAD